MQTSHALEPFTCTARQSYKVYYLQEIRGVGRPNQKFDLGGYKWVKETKQPHKKFKLDCLGGIYTQIPPVATPLNEICRMY